MSYDGSGNYSVIYTFVYDTVISETEMNAQFADIATALSTCITKDGQTTISANIPFNNYKITGLQAGTAATDGANLGQVQAQAWKWGGTAGGTADALTLSPSPAITAYAAGQSFRFIAGASPNTGAATVAISGLTTKAIQNNGSALAAGDIAAGKMYEITYDGAQFQLSKAFVALLSAFDTAGTGLTSSGTTVSIDAGGVDTTQIADDAVTLAKLAAGTGGELITWDASGDPAAVAVGTSGQVLTSNGAGAAPTFEDASTGVTLGTAQASTSGTSIDFMSIPAGTKQIIITLDGVSTSGSSNPLIQIGDSGGIETSGYLGAGINVGSSSSGSNYTTGWGIPSNAASQVLQGPILLTLLDDTTFTWVCSGVLGSSAFAFHYNTAGSKSLSAELDRVRITTVGGSDTFDAGKINIQYQ